MRCLEVYYDTDANYKSSKNANIWVSIDGSPYVDPISANKELIREDAYAALLQKEKYDPVGIFSPIGAVTYMIDEETNIPPIDYETILPVDLRKKLLSRLSQMQDCLHDPDFKIICIRGIPPTKKYLDDDIHDTLKDDYSVIKDRSDYLITNLEELNSRRLLIRDQYETLKNEYTLINKIATNLLLNRIEPAVIKADLKKSLNTTENELKQYNNKFGDKFFLDLEDIIQKKYIQFQRQYKKLIEIESPTKLDRVVQESASSNPIIEAESPKDDVSGSRSELEIRAIDGFTESNTTENELKQYNNKFEDKFFLNLEDIIQKKYIQFQRQYKKLIEIESPTKLDRVVQESTSSNPIIEAESPKDDVSGSRSELEIRAIDGFTESEAVVRPRRGVAQQEPYEDVSSLWYLLPLFMLIPGGIIAWAVNKDRNAPKARKMLLFSIILSVLLMLLLAGVFLLFMRWNASLYGSAY